MVRLYPQQYCWSCLQWWWAHDW